MGDDDATQLRTNYWPFRLELVGQAGGGIGSETQRLAPATMGLTGVGGRLCLDRYSFSNVDTQSGAFSGFSWLGGVCGGVLYNHDGGYQIRGGFTLARLLLNDGQFVIPFELNYIYRNIPATSATPGGPTSAAQHGVVLNVGLYYFFRTFENGRGVNPYIGALVGIGGVGGDNFGGVYGELQGAAGFQFNIF